ncbi:hypothetical protein KY290_022335 [Solanum tuberosum]|uniref:Chromo domain-containing protein n=1 Tax=Solanum tuberosum TaxID=4113 RepID=A0ABQ7V632_SOLTU|nr:hypothetical protein KY290_022335 [Solanum tuberosum]
MAIRKNVVQAAEDVIMQRQQFLQLLKDNLHAAQARMKFFAGNRRTDKEFAVGDLVYLKLLPYRQTSLALQRNLKLNSKYYGPYLVIARIVQPVAILQRQIVKQNNVAIVKMLVQWSNLPPEDATWEDYQHLRTTFPNFSPDP